MDIEEKDLLELCTLLFINWKTREKENLPLCTESEDLKSFFIPGVIRKKFEVFNVNVNVPDNLLIITEICTQGNPAHSQLVIKDILESIKNKKFKNGIPHGYTITTDDFVAAFPFAWPISSNDKVMKQLKDKWDKQKKPRNNNIFFDTDNKCDTPEWWLEVME